VEINKTMGNAKEKRVLLADLIF